MDHRFKEDRKTVPTLKISSISPRKNTPVPTLFFASLLEDEQPSKHGGGGRYGAVLEFKGEYFKKNDDERKKSSDIHDFQGKINK
jgi:hypothetical protein